MTMKYCWGCTRDLPREAFHNDKGKKDGLQSKCKVCQYARYQERLTEDPDKVRAIAVASQRRHRRRRMYNITNEEYDAMVEACGGRCEACGVEAPLVVDHDHGCCPGGNSCGRCIRGLLCQACNRGFGFLGDTASSVRTRLAYLERRSVDA